MFNMSAQQIPCPRLPANPRDADYKFFKRQLETYFLIDETADSKKLQVLTFALGRDGLDIFDGLRDPKDSYAEAIKQLDQYFGGKSSVLLRRKEFYESRQSANETCTEFSCRLRRLAKECGFDTNLQTMLRDIFVIGVRDNNLGERLLSENSSSLTFEQALQKAEAFERARNERRNVHAPNVNAVSHEVSRPANQSHTVVCFRCGSKSHKANHPTCPAANATCNTCQKRGHFRKMCRSSSSSEAPRPVSARPPRKAVNAVSQPVAEQGDDEPPTYNLFYGSIQGAASQWRRQIRLDGSPIEALADSGSEANVLPQRLVPAGTKMRPTSAKLQTFGMFPLEVLGEVTCEVTVNNFSVHAPFLVVDVPNDFALLSSQLSIQLHLMSTPVSSNSVIAHPETTSDSKSVIHQYEEKGIFEGVGVVQDFTYKIDIDPTVRPVACAPRRLPPAVIPQVEEVTEKLLADGIIRKVEKATSWCSPIVVARKSDNSIRLCTDLRNLNRAVLRPLYQIPSIDDVLSKVSGCRIFSKLDCNSAFHQIRVHEDSQELLTFGTPHGRYCWMRLPYGISSAPEVFQMMLDGVLKGIPGTYGYYDDILIAAKDPEEHEKILGQVFSSLLKAGITLNKSKCQFAQTSVHFLGHLISESGVQPSPAKVAAVRDMPEPANADQLRSFLGMANWIGQRFIPHYASMVSPLWTLLKKDHPYEWTEVHSTAFQTLKEALEKVSSLSWFDPHKKCKIFTDASAYGLGCCLLQDDRPVAYASRSLSDTEKRYSVIEKEFLGTVFALTKFRRLILFTDCTVHTDHKPILGLLKKPIDSLPTRIQRWTMIVQGFNITVEYVQGASNFLADALSRNPPAVSSVPDQPSEEENAEWTLCFLAKSLPLDLRQVAEATAVDPILQQVVEAAQSNWPSTYRHLQPYYSFKDEITLKESSGLHVLFRSHRILLPSSLVTQFLSQVHEGHVGLTKMKDVVRSCAYWPNYSADIQSFIKRCSPCSILEVGNHIPPVEPIADKVTHPYEQIAIDLTGPSERTSGNTLLTIIDLYSRYPEAYILRHGTSTEIIKYLRQSFARFGIPERVLSDNGTAFTSVMITEFFERLGVKHIRSSNYHPISNGCVERLHRTLKDRMAKIQLSTDTTFETALDRSLFDIRSTPNAMTGCTPAKLFLGREVRTTLSLLSQQAPATSRRFPAQEYAAAKSTKCSEFDPGDRVYFRKGSGPFTHLGRIIGRKGPYTYNLLDLNIGRERTYNVRDLKPRFTDDHSLQEANLAYDDAIPSNTNTNDFNSTTSPQRSQFSTQTPPRHSNTERKQYNLRKRDLPMSAYRF